MGQALEPRVIRSGPYRPTVPYTGDDDGSIFLKRNLITQGRDGRYIERVYSGEGNQDETLDMVPLTGTLDLTIDSDTVFGAGTLFFTECHLGQRILLMPVDGSFSYLIIPRRIVSDTEMQVWINQSVGPPWPTIAGLTGWQMPRLWTQNQQRAVALWGNTIELDKGSILSVGSGELTLNGQPLQGSSLSMTREPQISIFDPVTSNYANYVLGMDTPTSGYSAAAAGGGTKGMQGGNYSLVLTPSRTQTGGYNNPTLRFDVTIATNDQVAVTFPAMDTTNGQDAWDVWVTTFAFSLGADLNYLNGPWFFYTTVTSTDVSSAGGTFNIEWLDAEVEVNETVTFNNDPPSQAEFIELLNFTPVWLSCRGKGFTRGITTTVDPSPGPFIEPAKPTNIEVAPIEIQFASSPPETIIGGASADGRIYLLTTHHLEIAQATPDETVPILIRPFWRSGFANPEQLVPIPGGQLYGFPTNGPTRSSSTGDESTIETSWAAWVLSITRNWNVGQVLMGFDPYNNMVVLFHIADHLNTDGFWTTRMLGFGLSQDFWVFDGLISSPTADRIVSGVTTLGDRLEILVGGRGTTDVTDNLLTEEGNDFATENGDFIVLE